MAKDNQIAKALNIANLKNDINEDLILNINKELRNIKSDLKVLKDDK